jgi:hypothetical protein
LFAALITVLCVNVAAAQGVIGGAVVVSRLPRGDSSAASSVAVAPSGLTNGGVLFGGVILNRLVAVQAEVSVVGVLKNVWQRSGPAVTIVDTMRHRDTLVSALVRLRASSWCDAFVGGGIDFERTADTAVAHSSFPNAPGEYSSTRSSSATRAVFTTGLDFPIRLSTAFALLPTGRIHIIRRRTRPQLGPSEDPTLSTTSSYVFRFGFGGRLEF